VFFFAFGGGWLCACGGWFFLFVCLRGACLSVLFMALAFP
jgi:hypothetical protein